MTKAEAVVERLKDLLTTEKELLLAGKARQVASLADEKLSAMNDLEEVLAGSPSGTMLEGVRSSISTVMSLASENSAHFEAVRNGLRNAAARLETLGSGSLVGSYSQDGRQMSFTGATGRYLKRV